MFSWTKTVALALLAIPLAIPQTSPDWPTLDRQAEDLYNKGDLKEAIRVARLAVDAAANPTQSSRSLDRLGFFEYTAGDMKDGESSLLQALDLRTKLGKDTPEYAESANDIALLYRDSGRFPEARAFAEQAVAIRTRVLGPRDPRIAESLNTLASVLALIGEYDLAITHFERALAIHESQPGPSEFSEEYGTLCINLAGTYQRAGKYGKSEALFQKGLAVLRIKPGINHPAYAASLVGYGYLQADLGHYSTAEKIYDEAGKLLLEQLGDQHPAYSAFLNNRAALYYALGNLKTAESDYRKSLDLKRKIYGPAALTVGASLRNLARLVYGRNPPEGEQLFQDAVDIYSKNPKPPSFDYASALLGLGEAQKNRGDLATARQTLEHASRVVSEGLGTRHPLYAAVLSDLGLVYQAAREYPQAVQRFQEAIAIVRETRGENHPDLAQYLERLAAVYDASGDFAAAEPLYRRSAEISDRALTDMLAVGSEANKDAALANLEDPIPALIAFQKRAGDRLPDARALAFEVIARRKGRLLDQLHDWGQSLRENPDPAIRTRFEQWKALLQCQASLTVAMGYRDLKPAVVGTCAFPGTELEGRYERLLHDLRTSWTEPLGREALRALDGLKQRTGALETALSREIPQFSAAIRPPAWTDIQSRLAPDELLIEFADYAEPGAANRRYGAFLLAHSGHPQWIDVGPAAPIDLAVQDLITAANDWTTAVAAAEKRSANSARETAGDALKTLSQKLQPITVALSEKKPVRRLLIAPDGMLNLLPFAALSHGRGLLIEHLTIAYITASRDLVSAESTSTPAGPIVIAVSPAIHAERLEGAAQEARDLQRRMPQAQLLGESQATEQRIKQLHRPALLHIVGHGIVRGNEDCRQTPSSPGCRLARMNPAARVMSLSAIILEEANGRGGASPEDGLLTALELQTLDLQGTEMLVLSQCRMADGVPSSGEGVFGMRRAASIAGVKTFVAPLWKVADNTERTLMDRFYQELSQGTGRAEALRRAQLQLLRNPRTSSFLEWAPVILTGDPAPLPASFFAR